MEENFKFIDENLPIFFVQVARCVLLDKTLPHAEFRLYCYIAARCDPSREEKFSWVTQTTIAADLGLSRVWVSRTLTELHKRGLIRKEIKNGHNIYYLEDVKKVYGIDIARKRWNKSSEYQTGANTSVKKCKTTMSPKKRDVNNPLHVNDPLHVNNPLHDDVNDPLHDDVNDTLHKEDEVKEDEEKNMNICTHTLSLDLNSKDQVDVLNIGGVSTYLKNSNGVDPHLALRKEAQEKSRLAEQVSVKNRFDRKKLMSKMPDGITVEEWEQLKCSREFHAFYETTMRENNFHASKVSTEALKRWKIQFFPKVGDINSGLTVIEFVVKNWAKLVKRFNLPSDSVPTLSFFWSGYIEQIAGIALKDKNIKSDCKNNSNGWDKLIKESGRNYE